MGNLSCSKRHCVVFVFFAATVVVASAQTFTSLYSFAGPDGANPYANLAQGADGNFYGTTEVGGANCTTNEACGTVFAITPTGALSTLYSFCQQANCADGAASRAALMQTMNGDFYGTTEANGAHGQGVILEITPVGTLTTLYSF